MRRAIIAAAAVVGVGLAATAGVVGTQAYLHDRTPVHVVADPPATEVQQHDYLAAVASWPYPLAPGDELPARVPNPRSQVPTPDTDRAFVSFFSMCSWEGVLLHGPAARHADAITALTAWNLLPQTVSTASNADGSWKAAVLDPAVAGDLGPMAAENATDCATYRHDRVASGEGIALKRAAPSATPTLVGSAPIAGGTLSVTEQYGVDTVHLDAPALGGQNATVIAAFGASTSWLCTNRTLRFDSPPVATAGGSFPLPFDGARWLDPSFLQAVALFPADTAAIDCGAHPPLATAALDWSALPNRRPGLKIHDGGVRHGAAGHVASESGAPLLYVPAKGDDLQDIATRLGVTADDLAFMTPWSPSLQDDHTVYAGDGIVIDPARFRPDYGPSPNAVRP